ncbi:ArsR/SmtB family transcription factor [Gordonia soli]|uniref:Putative ArsR family transcriptional regulator n=1 Tax=Gordonia soli NBRC 108243 TaxID=1223545 RepID=M0QR44_9ACTN|nr:helix-turn-helix domain-containing protein [Gordonia soli]GAC70854.1 putative ArsR family transcriptional regulator [Gordonia soli NBRC 108243]
MTEQTGVDVDSRIGDHLPASDITLQGVLDALADPVRRTIVRELAESGQQLSCGVFDIDVSVSTRTHHFKVLRQAGIIRQRYEGTVKLNELRRADLDAAVPGLVEAIVGAPESGSRGSR